MIAAGAAMYQECNGSFNHSARICSQTYPFDVEEDLRVTDGCEQVMPPSPITTHPDSSPGKCRLVSGSLTSLWSESWIKQLAQTISKEIERQDDEHDGQSREDRHVRRLSKVVARIRQHRAPLRRRRLRAETKKAQTGRRQNS